MGNSLTFDNSRPPKAVDGLVRIGGNRDVSVLEAQCAQECGLGDRRVLVFVDENEVELVGGSGLDGRIVKQRNGGCLEGAVVDPVQSLQRGVVLNQEVGEGSPIVSVRGSSSEFFGADQPLPRPQDEIGHLRRQGTRREEVSERQRPM